MIEFKEWPKTPRLNRGMIVTEKIDGTNAAVIVELIDDTSADCFMAVDSGLGTITSIPEGSVLVGAQSRKRLIKPGKTTDNAGFAHWVRANAAELAQMLGIGYHYGEWWGKGVQGGYDQDGKRFSLFNVVRYAGVSSPEIGLGLVPVLYEGPFDTARTEGGGRCGVP